MKPVQKLSEELPFIRKIEKLKIEVDSFRPLAQEVKEKIIQKLRLDWNYNTNAIEGNSFTRGETVSLLMEGITAKGKPLKDAMDIEGHNRAIDFLMSLVKEDRNIAEADIRSLHKIVLGNDYFNPAETADGVPTRKLIKGGVYKSAPNHVRTKTGEVHYYSSVEDTPVKMQELIVWLNESTKTPNVNSVVLAAMFHHRFVAIHPFDDGNGRMTRLLTNYILLQGGYPISVIKQDKREEYYSLLAQADSDEIIPFIGFINETVENAFEIYLKAIRGEEINEENDIDKEIEIFVKGYQKEDLLKEEKNPVALNKILDGFMVPFINTLISRLNKFSELFFKFEKTLIYQEENWDLGNNDLIIGIADSSFGNEFKFVSTSNLFKSGQKTEKEIYQSFGIEINNIKNFEIIIYFQGFKKNNKQNNLQIQIEFIFGKYNYEIKSRSNRETYLSNYYHIIPSENEVNELVKAFVQKEVMDEIKKWDV